MQCGDLEPRREGDPRTGKGGKKGSGVSERLGMTNAKVYETHAQLVLGDRVCEAPRKIRNLLLGQERDRVRPRRALPFRLRHVARVRVRLGVILALVLVHWVGGRGRVLGGEEALEDALRLPLGRVLEVDPDVHAPRAAQRGVEPLDVVRRREQQPASQEPSAPCVSTRRIIQAHAAIRWWGGEGRERRFGLKTDLPALGGGDAVEAVQEAAQGERRAVAVLLALLALGRGRAARGGGGAGRGRDARGRLVAGDAARERRVEVFEQEDAPVPNRAGAGQQSRIRSPTRPPPNPSVLIFTRNGDLATALQ